MPSALCTHSVWPVETSGQATEAMVPDAGAQRAGDEKLLHGGNEQKVEGRKGNVKAKDGAYVWCCSHKHTCLPGPGQVPDREVRQG